MTHSRKAAQFALDEAQEAQAAFWDALANLETLLALVKFEETGEDSEVEVEGIDDLEGATIDTLLGKEAAA